MLKYLQIGKREAQPEADSMELSIRHLALSPDGPISLNSLNDLHENIKQRIYRSLIPRSLLEQFDIDPITWKGPDKEMYVTLRAAAGTGLVTIEARSPFDPDDPFFILEIADSNFDRLELNLIVLSDPGQEPFPIDTDETGRPTMFGTLRRNRPAEVLAMAAGLAPGQVRQGLHGSAVVFQHLESLMISLGHRSLLLEPLTYASAWIFERRGFAYFIGHQLMNQIHEEFQPGGQLHAALDGSTPFRQPDQWRTVRGRAWAIHDGILDVLDRQWDRLRMIKQIGREANVNTFPDAEY